jgi:hypothetical protein
MKRKNILYRAPHHNNHLCHPRTLWQNPPFTMNGPLLSFDSLEQFNMTEFFENLGAFPTAPETGLSGAPRSRVPAPTFVRIAAERHGCFALLQKQIRRICDPLRGSASGKRV